MKGQIAIVGLGTIGSFTAIGSLNLKLKSILLIDRDIVEEHNIGHQMLYHKDDIGMPKAIVAEQNLKSLAKKLGTMLKPCAIHLNHENISILKDCDLILDCTDNMSTRFLINDYCRKEKKPWIYAAAIRNQGIVYPILEDKACLSCIMPNARSDESCAISGIELTAALAASSIQLSLANKILSGKKIIPKLQRFSIPSHENQENDFVQIKTIKGKNCPACNGKYDFLIGKHADKASKLCSKNMYQIMPSIKWKKSDYILAKKQLSKSKNYADFGQCIRIPSITLFMDGRALVKANQENKALAIYSSLLGR